MPAATSTAHLLDGLRARLLTEHAPADDGWLAARHAGLARERTALLARIDAAAAAPGPAPDLDRLAVDVDHHLQRRRDLAWDDVELELGGSE
jgi:hypothetical protein